MARGQVWQNFPKLLRFMALFPSLFIFYQRVPNPPEFAQPRLSRVKARSSPARGYKFGCVCSYMAGHYPGILMTSHIGTNTPKCVPPRWRRPRFDLTQTGLCKFGLVWSSLTLDQFVAYIFWIETTFFCHVRGKRRRCEMHVWHVFGSIFFLGHILSRPDPCSVDFGRENPKF